MPPSNTVPSNALDESRALPRSAGLIRQFLRKADINRPVFFAILTRAWSLLAGPVTALLILMRFSPELQGYYYTFASIIALQGYLDLGLSTVLIQYASHEWSELALDKSGKISGNPDALSRLRGLARFSVNWFFTSAILVAGGLGIGGYLFFRRAPATAIHWTLPWLSLSFLAGVAFLLIPALALLEGCNQVVRVYTFRFVQCIFLSLGTWLAIGLGANLWVAAIASMINISVTAYFLRRYYYEFIKTLISHPATGPRLSWRSDILSMQWRMALSGISGYLTFSFFTPVLFKYQGSIIAGQMGITLTLISVLSSISTAWVSPRVPYWGILISRKAYSELDKLFWRLSRTVLAIATLCAAAIWMVIYLLHAIHHRLASRFLPPLPTAIFLAASLLIAATVPMSAYLRAHKKEPLAFPSLASGILVAVSNLTLGKYYSAVGMAGGYLLIQLILVPIVALIWYRCRAAWHY
jgi:O-antigen/teichoic acid export membrane protein